MMLYLSEFFKKKFIFAEFLEGAFLGMITLTICRDIYHRCKLLKAHKRTGTSVKTLLKADDFFKISLEITDKLNVTKAYETYNYQRFTVFFEVIFVLSIFFLLAFTIFIY